MDIFILVLTCVINLLLGVFVLLRDPKKSYARLFMLVSVLISVWIIANYFTNYHTTDLAVTNLANKIAFVGGFGLVLGELLFTYTFPLKRHVPRLEKGVVLVLSLAVIGLSMTESVAGVASLDDKGHLTFSVGELLWVFVVGFIVIVGLMAKNLLAIPKEAGATKKRQARLILLAFGSTAVIGILLNAIIPGITGDWSITQYTPLVTVILVGVIAYTIIKHGLFDIRLAVVRTVAYILSLLTLAGAYYLVAYVVSLMFLQPAHVDQNPFSIIIALLLAFTFHPVRLFFDRYTNRIFYRGNYNVSDFFARFSKQISATNDLESLLQLASDELKATLKTEYVCLFVHYGRGRRVHVGSGDCPKIDEGHLRKLDALQLSPNRPILTDTQDEKDPIYKVLRSANVAVALPLFGLDKRIGYLFLGDKRSGGFTSRDAKTLETASDQLVVAIQNVLSVQEVKDINETLQERIEKATKRLRASNSQLQRLDEAKDEFVSMASHQLRTPLTSVKGYISMVLEGDVGKITPTQRKLLGEAFTSSERMVHLINDFLNVSRLQTGKFIVDRRPVDLTKVVAQEVDSLQTTAQARDLKLVYRPPSYFPILFVDEGKLRQVMMNFIDNAIYYSHENTKITIELSVEGGDAVFKVHDTGIGIPKDEQVHIFTKFFRATNARKQRPDGTGVGLFLAKKIIDAHEGTISLESVENEGSTFGFRLPVKKLSKAK